MSEPISATQYEDAYPLIGKTILAARKKEGLGYYGTLLAIDPNLKNPFFVRTDTGSEKYFPWIVQYPEPNK